MRHPTPIDPRDHAVYAPDRMGKTTLFRSDRVLVGLNFDQGQLQVHAFVHQRLGEPQRGVPPGTRQRQEDRERHVGIAVADVDFRRGRLQNVHGPRIRGDGGPQTGRRADERQRRAEGGDGGGGGDGPRKDQTRTFVASPARRRQRFDPACQAPAEIERGHDPPLRRGIAFQPSMGPVVSGKEPPRRQSPPCSRDQPGSKVRQPRIGRPGQRRPNRAMRTGRRRAGRRRNRQACSVLRRGAGKPRGWNARRSRTRCPCRGPDGRSGGRRAGRRCRTA